ncbi:MAG: hypothetical protein GKR89_06975 [Candidatus Latescibacteria bacterium]|nr:hypothetical protein [Candidatus Latescibacterota bacterium]
MILQTLPDPYPLASQALNQLLALGGAYSPSISHFEGHSNLNAKQFFLTGWAQSDQVVSWRIRTPTPGPYRCALLLNSAPGRQLMVQTDRGTQIVTVPNHGWQRLEAEAPIDLAGTDRIRLRLVESVEPAVELKSIELVHQGEAPRLAERVRRFRGDASWMKEAGYGIMVQVGGWSYPATGDKKPWPGFAETFDAEAFVDSIAAMGGQYLVWSATWCDYLFPAPSAAIAQILPQRVSRRDLIDELIEHCRRRGIRFVLYYHLGHDQPEVLLAKGWQAGWDQDGRDRSAWLDCEEDIFRQIGQRYGRGLDAIFLDDACCWYPANFESLGAALKTGYLERLIGYNSWILPSHTPFQDFYCGEGFTGAATPWPLEDGVIAEGPQQGLQMWGCCIFDGPDWGVHRPETQIDPPRDWTVDKIAAMVPRLEQERYSMVFNLLAYEDGRFAPDSYHLLCQAARRLGRA